MADNAEPPPIPQRTHPVTQRYVAEVCLPGVQNTVLIVPLPPNTTVRDFRQKAADRARRAVPNLPSCESAAVHVFSANGPLVDDEDFMEDVVLAPASERIFLVFPGAATASAPRVEVATSTRASAAAESNRSTRSADPPTTQLRLITPNLARQYDEVADITPILTFTRETLWREIVFAARKHFNLPSPEESTMALDLYSSEVLIEPKSYDYTAGELGLEDLAVGGTLNLYVVVRRKTAAVEGSIGADATFSNGDGSRWYLTPRQSERGLACFLSSVRVFAHLISAKSMQEHQQEAILRTVHSLFRFPPALNAFRALMDGSSLHASQCTVILQVCYWLLLEMIQLPIIKRHRERTLEGSRLMFGSILQKAVGQVTPSDHLVFQRAYTTFDLKDTITDLAVTNPVQTARGLMERSTLETYQFEEERLDPRILRIIRATGGIKTEVSYFDLDKLALGSRATKAGPEMSTDLNLLSNICEQNGLAVSIPSGLSSVKAPCLTLDSDAFLAVYTGRTPCGDPGKDFQIFRPLEGKEFAIDPAAVTQCIQPIFEERRSEGTSLFELVSEGHGNSVETPEELIMFCLDCSRSMHQASFSEQNDQLIPISTGSEVDDVVSDYDMSSHSFQYMRTWLAEHESFLDFVGLIYNYGPTAKSERAEEILDTLTILLWQEMEHLAWEITKATQKISKSRLNRHTKGLKSELFRLRSLASGIESHYGALADFLVFSATTPSLESTFTWWTPGEPAPIEDIVEVIDLEVEPIESPPSYDFRCPISHDLMEDPVKSSDGFTYDRRSIERWFQIRHSSPSTGLPLTDISLKRNEEVFRQINRWKSGQDIIEAYGTSEDNPTYILNISAPNSYLVRMVPVQLTVNALYKLVYRGMQGTLDKFDILQSGSRLVRSEEALSTLANVKDGTYLTVKAQSDTVEAHATSTDRKPKTRSKALIKIYEEDNGYAFGYWVSQSKTLTFASVFFKYWRYLWSKGEIEPTTTGREYWTGLTSTGDNSLRGSRNNAWDLMTLKLNSHEAKGTLQEEGLTEDTRHVASQSQPPVLKIALFGYESPQARDRRMRLEAARFSRLDTAKHVFGAFINRTLAYGFQQHMGLTTFGSAVTLSQKISGVVEDFRSSIMQMKAEGDTALFDAVDSSITKLIEYAQSRDLKKVAKRVIVLSDGADNKSKMLYTDLAIRARQHGIVIDSICIGNDDRQELMRLCQSTGGYKFWPHTIESALGICELEPFLSLDERPPVVHASLAFNVKEDVVSRERCPARKQHPHLNDDFVQITSLANRDRTTPQPAASSNNRNARLLSEIRSVAANPHPHYDVYVSESDMGFWKIAMSGPPETPYESGVFLLYLDMGEKYPLFAPNCRFITPMLHPNVNRHGRICHSIFSRNWTTDTTNIQVLNVVYSLLLDPEFSDPINTAITLDYHWDQVSFADEVRSHITQHASKTREEHKQAILGEVS